jgi:hypothetical protein
VSIAQGDDFFALNSPEASKKWWKKPGEYDMM